MDIGWAITNLGQIIAPTSQFNYNTTLHARWQVDTSQIASGVRHYRLNINGNQNLTVDGVQVGRLLVRDFRSLCGSNDILICERLLRLLRGIYAWATAPRSNGETRPWEPGHRIVVRSGYRSPEQNAIVNSTAERSQHMMGRAIDFVVPLNTTPGFIQEARRLGVRSPSAVYATSNSGIHLDSRDF